MPGASSRPGEPSPGCGTGNNPGRAGHNPMSRSDAGPTRSVDSACTVTAFPRRCHGISSHVFPLNFPGGDRGPDSRAGCLKVGLPLTWPPAGKVSHRRCRTLREERSPHGRAPESDFQAGVPKGVSSPLDPPPSPRASSDWRSVRGADHQPIINIPLDAHPGRPGPQKQRGHPWPLIRATMPNGKAESGPSPASTARVSCQEKSGALASPTIQRADVFGTPSRTAYFLPR